MTSTTLRPCSVFRAGIESVTTPVTDLEYCVIIPAYNAANFIEAAVASVRAQTIPPAEIIVIDDASTDGTAEICAARGVRVERMARSRGPSAARNRGVALTSSPAIGFLDADDEWLPIHAEQVLATLLVEDVVFAASDAERFGTETGRISHGLLTRTSLGLEDLFILENPIVQSAVMILRTAFEMAGGYDESLRYSEDYDLWTRVIELGRFGYVNEPTVRRRMHPAQLTFTNRPELVRSWSNVRRRALRRRLASARPAEREQMLSLLDEATKTEIEWAIWTGERCMLNTVRTELDLSDTQLGLGSRLRLHGGTGKPARRVWQDVRCVGRGLLNRVRGRSA